MNFMKYALGACILFSAFTIQQSCLAQDQASWKDTNDKAIQEMRKENYSESERLFRQALTQCSDSDGKAVIQENLEVLLEKQGKKPEGSALKNNDSSSSNTSTVTNTDAKPAEDGGKISNHKLIEQLDAQIKAADDKGDLQTLQSLFQQKLQALKARDGGETLDYAYCLHFRAQVLQNMHRDDEANALEAQATRLRDQLRSLSSGGPSAPRRTRSQIGEMSFKMPKAPKSRNRPAPEQDSYASATPGPNPRAAHMPRNFGVPSNKGDTSGYLNGNPNSKSSW